MDEKLDTCNNVVVGLLIVGVVIFASASLVFGIQSLVVGTVTEECGVIRDWFLVIGSFIISTVILGLIILLIKKLIHRLEWTLYYLRLISKVFLLFMVIWSGYGVSIYDNPNWTTQCAKSVLGVFDLMVQFQVYLTFAMILLLLCSFIISWRQAKTHSYASPTGADRQIGLNMGSV